MRIALGRDEANALTAFLIEELGKRGHSIVLRGPLDPADPDGDWPLTSSHVAELVARRSGRRHCLLLDRNGSLHRGQQAGRSLIGHAY